MIDLQTADGPRPLRVGDLFEHARLLDTDWKPANGQRYADAPPAVCRVTAIRNGAVYYRLGRGTGRATQYFPASAASEYVRTIMVEVTTIGGN